MAILGGSPLGLINVKSVPLNGRSTFNDGNSRGVSVAAYNSGVWNAGFRGNSLFSGSRVVRAWPNATAYREPAETNQMPATGNTQIDDPAIKKALSEGKLTATPQGKYKMRKSLHNNEVYDISVLNIIEALSMTRGSLKMADFAYLKDLGVIPNNRLMIARKFPTPCGDNIIAPRRRNSSGKIVESGAQATLISWVPESNDFLKISFGEEWVDAEGDFKEIFNKIGADVMGGKMGDVMGKLANVIPLPGFTEGFQRQMLEKMGFLSDGASSHIPSGNPNLIKEAKRRKTVPKEQAGSGLNCKVDIEMTCEYEQKFISGVDPTIVWMDIIGMIAKFGTSPGSFYGLSGNLASKINTWLADPMSLVMDAVKAIKTGLVYLAGKVMSAVTKFVNESMEAIKARQADREAEDEEYPEGEEGDKMREADEKDREREEQEKMDQKEMKMVDKFAKMGAKFLNFIGEFLKTGLKTLAQKYKIEIQGVVNALSGAPSTPWHITIGNPLRPVFCAGDLYTSSVSITLGPTLAFNDLPASIKANFTLTNARPWGLGEIMAKFNSGYLRTLDAEKSFYEIEVDKLGNIDPIGGFSWEGVYVSPEELASFGSAGSQGANGGSGGSAGSLGSNGQAASSGSKGTEKKTSSVKEDKKGTNKNDSKKKESDKKAEEKKTKAVDGKKDKGKKK